MAKREIIEILRKYIDLLRAEGITVNKAFLYGSYLSNTETDESDIDLMIVTENDNDDYLAGKIWSLTPKINSKIEPFLVSSNRFYNNENSPLIDLVKRTGLEIA
ncbi:MAG: nucleotidyltransferase domain-containing protein [Chlorobi bacterium]|nr:nucleotidyltransferase domain-containing protein [Chlorobiota bacterium]